MAKFEVFHRKDAPEKFDQITSSLHPAENVTPSIYGRYGKFYFPRVLDKQVTDMSLMLMKDNQPVIVVECDISKGVFGRYGHPLLINILFEEGHPWRRKALYSVMAAIIDIAGSNNASKIRILDTEVSNNLSEIGKVCLDNQATACSKFTGIVDLSGTEDDIRRSLRKSYRSLVNWGKKNLDIKYVNKSIPDEELFRRYQSFHAEVAGRITRPGESWDATFEWLCKGGGELLLGYLDTGRLVSGNLIIYGENIAVYSSGVYDRDQFDLPLSHWPLLLSIYRSKERGMKIFEIGDIPMQAEVSEKEQNIGYFKRGFSQRIRNTLVWEINICD